MLIPYVKDTKAALLLPQEMCAVAFFDVFAAHRCASFLSKLKESKIMTCFIPAGCTGLLQPLDRVFVFTGLDYWTGLLD